jgi:hypothetical protein
LKEKPARPRVAADAEVEHRPPTHHIRMYSKATQWKPGQSGNPHGNKAGACHQYEMAASQIDMADAIQDAQQDGIIR